MAIEVTVTENVTTVTVSEESTGINVSPQVTEVAVSNIDISAANAASGISYAPQAGHSITSTNVQGALNQVGENPFFTSTLKTKLDGIEELADVTDTANVVASLTGGDNTTIASDGTIDVDVVGALSAGTNITIGADGVISASSLSLTDVYTANSEAEHLSLSPTPNQGDVVIRTDENKTYIHNGGTAGTMADYTELASTTNGVQSLNGDTGAITFGKADLDGYVANEFIDWTVSQQTPIHADNYTNTTYTAGNNITIDANNVISSTATGSGGGTTYTEGAGINISDDNVISWDTTSALFDQAKFRRGDTGLDSGVYIEAWDMFAAAKGLYIAHYDDDTSTTTPIAILSTDGMQFQKDVFFYGDFTFGQARLFEQLELTDDDYIESEQTVKTSSRLIVDTPPNTEGSKKIANVDFVREMVQGGVSIPSLAGESGKKLKVGYNTDTSSEYTYWAYDNLPIPLFGQTVMGTDLGAIYLVNFDSASATYTYGTAIQGAGGTTVSESDGTLTISSTSTGLPTQSASTEGYVLKSENSEAVWSDLSTASLPAQTDNSGKFLTTNGTTASWGEVDAYPTQTNNSGKFLTTDGTEVSWGDVDAFPNQGVTNQGKFLTTNGTDVLWSTIQSSVPDQSGHNGKYLVTDGSSLSWSTINTAGQTANIEFTTNTIGLDSDATLTFDCPISTSEDAQVGSLEIIGTETPSVTSATSYEITAPNGVTHNGIPLPIHQGTFTVSSTGTLGTWNGSSGITLVKENNYTVKLNHGLSLDTYYAIVQYNDIEGFSNISYKGYAPHIILEDGHLFIKRSDNSSYNSGRYVVQIYEA